MAGDYGYNRESECVSESFNFAQFVSQSKLISFTFSEPERFNVPESFSESVNLVR